MSHRKIVVALGGNAILSQIHLLKLKKLLWQKQHVIW